MTNVRFAYGKTLSGVVTRTEPWDKFVKVITKNARVYKDKADSTNAPNILGGPTDNRGKEDRNVLARSMLTLDFDDLPDDFEPEDMAFALDTMGCASVAYSTFSHRTERAGGKARLRVIVLLEKEIPKAWYPAAVRSFVDALGVECSPESYTVAQVMFLHSAMEGYEDQAWTHVVEADPYPVNEAWSEGVAGDGSDGDDLDDLIADIAYEPMDVTWAEVDRALELFPAEGLEYDDWLMVGLGLWHQSRGSVEDDGFGRWLAWSKLSSKHDGKLMRKKWKSMGGRKVPVTMASVFARVGGLGVVREALDGLTEVLGGGQAVSGDEGAKINGTTVVMLYNRLSESAQAVDGTEEYDAFKKVLQSLPETRLGSDYRAMIAEELYSGWGKRSGLTKADIKKALKPDRSVQKAPKYKALNGGAKSGDLITEADCWNAEYPDWLQGWVYDEVSREFVQLETGHAIKREAFGMKYDRMRECAEHETNATTLSSNIFPIPTVAGRMYWPGKGKVFQDPKGLTYINTWLGNGGGTNVVVPEAGSFEVGDDSVEGQACELFLRHLELTVADKRERELMLDWMAFVYANPGARVRWALLLWGIEGNGKSYFYQVLGRLMGRDSRTVAASTIEERFTDWAEECRLIGIEEIRIAGTNKWRTLDKMKPFISNDEIQVEGKGIKAHVVPNFASYMLFTNHQDAIPVTEGDRRYFIVFTRHRTKQDLLDAHGGEDGVKAYFQGLFDVSLAGAGGIGRMLLDRQYGSEFDHNGRAPESYGRNQMQLLHVTPEQEALMHALKRYAGPTINEKVIDVTSLQRECEFDPDIELPQTRQLSHFLNSLGYDRGPRRIKINGRDVTYYYSPSKIDQQGAERLLKGQ
jgi:hypothetical protein